MKKLEKLLINPEKVIRNEELVSLKGGYLGGECCKCYSGGDPWGSGQGGEFVGYIYDATEYDCNYRCFELEGDGAWGQWTC